MYTMEQWAEDGSLKIAVGELVADEVVRELRDCVPPTTLGRIFQVGEVRDQDSEHPAWPIFDTFKQVEGGWIYCGACLRGQTEPRKGYIESLYGIVG